MGADDSTDSRGDPGRQRTVAELLAQHGGGSSGGSRRRRRAAEDDDEKAPTPPKTVANPVPEQRWAGATGYGQSIDPLTGAPIDPPSGQTFGTPPGNAAPGNGSPGAGTTGSYRSMPLTRTDPPTEEFPAFGERSWATRAKGSGPMTGPITSDEARSGGLAAGPGAAGTGGLGAVAGPATGQVSRADLFDDADDDEDEDHDDQDSVDQDGTGRENGDTWGRRATAAPAGLAERGEHGELVDGEDDYDDDYEDDERPGGVTGWLGLILQCAVGAVVGALLWVWFSYLWMHIPVVALIAAVLATAVLVLVVRAIRRSDDLQTTMLAVLVGLVVTISPAVLLLAVR